MQLEHIGHFNSIIRPTDSTELSHDDKSAHDLARSTVRTALPFSSIPVLTDNPNQMHY